MRQDQRMLDDMRQDQQDQLTALKSCAASFRAQADAAKFVATIGQKPLIRIAAVGKPVGWPLVVQIPKLKPPWNVCGVWLLWQRSPRPTTSAKSRRVWLFTLIISIPGQVRCLDSDDFCGHIRANGFERATLNVIREGIHILDEVPEGLSLLV